MEGMEIGNKGIKRHRRRFAASNGAPAGQCGLRHYIAVLVPDFWRQASSPGNVSPNVASFENTLYGSDSQP